MYRHKLAKTRDQLRESTLASPVVGQIKRPVADFIRRIEVGTARARSDSTVTVSAVVERCARLWICVYAIRLSSTKTRARSMSGGG